MNRKRALVLILSALCIASFSDAAFSQNKKRVSSKTINVPFGVGGTFAIVGAPNGSISIEGTPKPEIEITATIQTEALTDADLDAVGGFTTFAIEEGSGRITLYTVGSHNKLGDKKIWKKIRKDLLALPFRIDYVVRVPYFCDLSVNGGVGSLNIAGVEGAIKASMVNSDATISLRGGSLSLTVGTGKVDLSFPERNWRSGLVDVELSNGQLNAILPFNLSADIDATAVSSGVVKNLIADLKPRRSDAPFTENQVLGKLGNGGIAIKFLVGNGDIELARHSKVEK